jgi:hypothetical protein
MRLSQRHPARNDRRRDHGSENVRVETPNPANDRRTMTQPHEKERGSRHILTLVLRPLRDVAALREATR